MLLSFFGDYPRRVGKPVLHTKTCGETKYSKHSLWFLLIGLSALLASPMTGSQPKEVDGQIVTKQGLWNFALDGNGRSNRVRDFEALISAFKVYLRALALESLPITIKSFLLATQKSQSYFILTPRECPTGKLIQRSVCLNVGACGFQ